MFGLNIDPMNPAGNPTTQELKELGVEVVRFSYHDTTDADYLDPTMLDFFSSRVDAYAAAGIKSLLIVGYSTYPGKPTTEADMSQWAPYIDNLTHRIKQIALNFAPIGQYVALQIWNEPDLPNQPGYSPGLRPEVYADMLDRAAHAIVEVNATIPDKTKRITIVGGGLCSGKPEWWREVYHGQPLNVLAIHPYGQRPQPNWPSLSWGFGYVGDLITNYQTIGGWGGEIWVTEFGTDHPTGSPDPEFQAEYLRRFYAEMPKYPAVKKVIWFCYSDGMVRPFGLIDGGGQRKPAYNAYRETALGG